MKIKVERCWGGGDRFGFRLILPHGAYVHVRGEEWTRDTARQALDLLEHNHRLTRRNVRFDHR